MLSAWGMYEEVPFGHEAEQRELDRLLLALDHLAEVVGHRTEQLVEGPGGAVGDRHGATG